MPRPFRRPDSDRAIAVLTATVVVCFITAALYWARAIFIPLALAIFFTFILSPVVHVLQRRGLGRALSVGLVMTATVLTVGAVGLVVGRQVAQLTQTLPDNAEKIKQKVATIKDWVSANQGSRLADLVSEIYDTFAESPTGPQLPGDPSKPPTVVVESSPSWIVRAQGFVSPAAEMLVQAAFTFILVVYMLLRREDLRNRVIRLVGQGRVTTTTKAVDEVSRRISRYLLAQFLLNTSFGLVITGVLLLMRIPYAPLWGFIAFLMRYVPYIGTWIGVIPPALFTFATSEGWGLTVGVLVLFLGLEALCNNIFEPLLYGSRLGLSEVAQLVATAFWAMLWGPIGMILAWPLTTCLLVIGKYVPQGQFLSVLLGDEPVLPPRVTFYQRLTARDQDEAAAIAEKELSTRPAEQVFDDLLVPALSVARQDAADGRLSDDDLGYVTGAVREVAEEVSEFKAADAPAGDEGGRARILIVPAKDAVDHAGTELLTRLLDPSLWEVDVAPPNTLTAELIERIADTSPAGVVIASLPPGGMTHTRYLCKRIRHRFPELKIVVGRWTGASADPTAGEPIRAAGADEVTTSLEATTNLLSGWRAVFAASPVTTRPESPKKPAAAGAIGTVPA
jgi:predicted PurR-regulated permease PerM/methylmalonyl-CoA mutase cobalamin-binding subunit